MTFDKKELDIIRTALREALRTYGSALSDTQVELLRTTLRSHLYDIEALLARIKAEEILGDR